jgi:hypothetical protein
MQKSKKINSSKEVTLNEIFKTREDFMHMLNNSYPNAYTSWPVDLSTKKGQNICRETALKGVEEMFEALGHLKNWKSHRKTDMPFVDSDEFLEEIVDAFNYFFSLMILIGVDSKDFYDAFTRKDSIIKDRLKTGY